VSLHPTGALGSVANAISGTRQAGYVFLPGPFVSQHAAMWSGTAASFVDMTPPGAGDSEMNAMSGEQQVGWARLAVNGYQQHATLWRSTPESAIDLHPHPGGISLLYGTCGTAQVGYSSDSVTLGPHAGIWFGSGSSFIDLHALLPGNPVQSVALAVDEFNGQFIVGGYASMSDGHSEAFIWVGVPSPSTAAPLLLAGLVSRRRARR